MKMVTKIKVTNTAIGRFKDKYEVQENGCWSWTGALGKQNYGNFFADGHYLRAPRAAWMLFIGEIPEGKIICHKCDDPNCVNPDHLFVGTQKDNIADMDAKERRDRHGKKGSENPKAIITEDDVREIRRRFAAGEGATKLAKEYGYKSRNRIYEIVKRVKWKHVE